MIPKEGRYEMLDAHLDKALRVEASCQLDFSP